MDGKIATAGEAVIRALEQLRPEDRFRIAVFSNNARFLEPGWQPVNEVNIRSTTDLLRSLSVEGGTNLYEGLEKGLSRLEADRTSAVLLISDGGANVGPTEHAAFLKLLQDKDVRVFTFVMGQGANVPLLGRIAEASGGFSMAVSNRDDLYGRILQAKAKLGREAMHGIEIDLDGGGTIEDSDRSFPTIYHGQQIVRLGRYTQPGEATLKLKARISGREETWETTVVLPEYEDRWPEMERLWAFARTRDIKKKIDDTGKEGELRQAIIDLATEYSLVTDYTSMVVVREERFEELGIDRRNRRRVERERNGRQVRMQSAPVPTRADAHRPMYGGRSSHGLGGGAADFTLVWLLGGAYVVGRMLRQGRQ